jgi:hypothetical protein
MRIFFPIIDNGMQLVQADYTFSLAHSLLAGAFFGHQVTIGRISYPYPDGAMNYATNMFLRSDADRLVTIDADLSFDPIHIKKLLAHEMPFVAGIYPKKQIGLEFPIEPLPETDPLRDPAEVVKVASVARGFTSIHRSVFEKFIAAGLCETYVDVQTGKPAWQFWKNQVGGHSEDFNFCERWRSIGGDVWIDKTITARHHGSAAFPL